MALLPADDMLSALQVADEFDSGCARSIMRSRAYKITTSSRRRTSPSRRGQTGTASDGAFDGIPENLALVHEAGVRAAMHPIPDRHQV
jgi:hypothetical protein